MDTGTIRRVRWVLAVLALTAAGAFLAWAILFGVNLPARFQAQSQKGYWDFSSDYTNYLLNNVYLSTSCN